MHAQTEIDQYAGPDYATIRDLSVDVETFSIPPLGGGKGVGMYKYLEHRKYKLLLFAYAVNFGKVRVIDLANGEKIPRWIMRALKDPTVKKHAHNAAFEIGALQRAYEELADIRDWAAQWHCTMVRASMAGLPLKLEHVAMALGLEEQKDAEGPKLIRYFCVPCKPTKANGQRVRNMPWHDPERWARFKRYNAQDVRTEMAIYQATKYVHISPKERATWLLDQRINARGILTDSVLVENAVNVDQRYNAMTMDKLRGITGIHNPKSDPQIKRWLTDRLGRSVHRLTKNDVTDLLARKDLPKIVRRALETRKDLKKTSITKFGAILRMACEDGRIRGATQHYGANRTGRWAGRGVQLQNLRRNDLPDLDVARDLVREGNLDLLLILYPSVSDVLSQLIRTAFIPREGYKLLVNDFSSIEARILAWLAGETWRLKVFRTHGKIYEASAAAMFRIPIETIDKKSPWRQKGKVAELAFGYGGGVRAAIKMGAVRDGLTEPELKALVYAWRGANRRIVKYWADVEKAAMKAIRGIPSSVGPVSFHRSDNTLWITLPSGRRLAYYRPRVREGAFGQPAIQYMGVDQQRKTWGWRDTWGGSLVENIVQAIARDLLRDAMLTMDKQGYNIVMHIHDETVCEQRASDLLSGKSGGRKCSVEEINAIMKALADPGTPYEGLPLGAEGYETDFYRKDS